MLLPPPLRRGAPRPLMPRRSAWQGERSPAAARLRGEGSEGRARRAPAPSAPLRSARPAGRAPSRGRPRAAPLGRGQPSPALPSPALRHGGAGGHAPPHCLPSFPLPSFPLPSFLLPSFLLPSFLLPSFPLRCPPAAPIRALTAAPRCPGCCRPEAALGASPVRVPDAPRGWKNSAELCPKRSSSVSSSPL